MGSSDETAPVVSIPSAPPRPQIPDSSDDEAADVSIPSKLPRRRLQPVDSSDVDSSDAEPYVGVRSDVDSSDAEPRSGPFAQVVVAEAGAGAVSVDKRNRKRKRLWAVDMRNRKRPFRPQNGLPDQKRGVSSAAGQCLITLCPQCCAHMLFHQQQQAQSQHVGGLFNCNGWACRNAARSRGQPRSIPESMARYTCVNCDIDYCEVCASTLRLGSGSGGGGSGGGGGDGGSDGGNGGKGHSRGSGGGDGGAGNGGMRHGSGGGGGDGGAGGGGGSGSRGASGSVVCSSGGGGAVPVIGHSFACPHDTRVWPVRFNTVDVSKLRLYLEKHWTGRAGLILMHSPKDGIRPASVAPFSGFGTTSAYYNEGMQLDNTLRIRGGRKSRLDECRECLPGFAGLEADVMVWIRATFGDAIAEATELYNWHILRQFTAADSGSGFGKHIDLADDSHRKLFVSVSGKLTVDPINSNGTWMVVDGCSPARYGAPEGSGLAFVSRIPHQSLRTPDNMGIVYKIVFFYTFKKDSELGTSFDMINVGKTDFICTCLHCKYLGWLGGAVGHFTSMGSQLVVYDEVAPNAPFDFVAWPVPYGCIGDVKRLVKSLRILLTDMRQYAFHIPETRNETPARTRT